jgi:hypothetical protein
MLPVFFSGKGVFISRAFISRAFRVCSTPVPFLSFRRIPPLVDARGPEEEAAVSEVQVGEFGLDLRGADEAIADRVAPVAAVCVV